MNGMRRAEKAAKTFRRLFVIGERKVFQEISNIVRIANEANAVVRRMIIEDGSGEAMAELLRSVRDLEKKSDDIAFAVAEGITGGAISPNVLDALLESVKVADNIIDYYYNLGRELERMSNTGLDPAQT